MDNILAPTVFESSMSEVGKSVAKRTAATDTGGILVSALRQEPVQNSDIEGGCGGPSLHPGESLCGRECAVNLSSPVCPKREPRGLIFPGVLRLGAGAEVSQPQIY